MDPLPFSLGAPEALRSPAVSSLTLAQRRRGGRKRSRKRKGKKKEGKMFKTGMTKGATPV